MEVPGLGAGAGGGGGGLVLLQGSLTQPYRRGRLISTCSKKCTPHPRKGRRCPRLAEAQWEPRHGKSTEGVPEREDSLRTCWLHRSWHGDSREQDVSLGWCPGHLRGHLWDTQQLRRPEMGPAEGSAQGGEPWVWGLECWVPWAGSDPRGIPGTRKKAGWMCGNRWEQGRWRGSRGKESTGSHPAVKMQNREGQAWGFWLGGGRRSER